MLYEAGLKAVCLFVDQLCVPQLCHCLRSLNLLWELWLVALCGFCQRCREERLLPAVSCRA